MSRFEDQIAAIRRRMRHGILKQVACTAAATFLAIHAVTAVMGIAGFSAAGFPLRFYLFSAAIAVLFGFMMAWVRSVDLRQVLIAMDVRLDLKDRISSAYEYHQRGLDSEVVALLISDATQKLDTLDTKQMVPDRLAGMVPLVGLLILINLAVISFQAASSGPGSAGVDPGIVRDVRTLLATYAAGPQKEDPNPASDGTRSFQKELDEIAKTVDRPSPDHRSLHSALNQLLLAVRKEKLQLARGLAHKIDMESLGQGSAKKVRRFQEMSLFQTETLKNLLDQMFNRRIPTTITGDMTRLADQQRLEKLLEQLSAKLDSEHGSSPPQSYDPLATQRPTFKSGSGRENVAGRPKGEGQLDPRQENTSLAAGAKPGEDCPPAASHPGARFDQGRSSAAGRGESQDQWRTPKEIENASGQTFKDQTAAAGQNDYRIHIRALTGIGKARVPTEDVSRPYRRAIESALVKEQLPPDYRDFIKGYFLSIGLGEETQNIESYP